MVSDFRIMAEDTEGGTIYSVHEVFYMNDHAVDFVYLPLSLISLDQEDLISELQLVLEAFEKPTLSIDNFPEEY